MRARTTSSNAPRITAKELNGVTGDPWMPVDAAAAKALSIGRRGFDYELATELLLGTKFIKPSAQMWLSTDDTEGVYLLAQGVARGQGKTEGYHERRIPLSRKVRQALLSKNTDELAKLAGERIYSIGAIFEMLKYSLTGLFGNGAPNGKDKNVDKTRVRRFAQPFEAQCDAQFFPELIDEIEADDREAVREKWLLALAERAESVLQSAFDGGPRSGQLRYRAQSAALGRLNAAMRGSKLPALAQALKSKKSTPFTFTAEETHEHA
jgi:CRISPR system Cascade subunit CasA